MEKTPYTFGVSVGRKLKLVLFHTSSLRTVGEERGFWLSGQGGIMVLPPLRSRMQSETGFSFSNSVFP